jgi:hypothetical protein
VDQRIREAAPVRWSFGLVREGGEEAHGLRAAMGRLQTQNAILRDRLTAVEAVALERRARIEDLQQALRSLPSAWAEDLARRFGDLGLRAAGSTAATGGRMTANLPHPQPVGVRSPAGPEPSRQPSRLPGSRRELRKHVAAIRARLDRRCREIDRELEEEAHRRLAFQARWARDVLAKLPINDRAT